jgi:hypothetical protein
VPIATVAGAQRPRMIWAICIFYGVSVLWNGYSSYLVHSGAIPLTPEQQQYFGSLIALDYAVLIIGPLVTLIAISYLFLMRKQAFYFFLLGLLISLSSFLWAPMEDWLAAIGEPGAIGAAIGFAIYLGVCIYTWWLMQRGVLQ